MEITYDKKADAMYLYFRKGAKIARTVELADVLMADLDKHGKVIGVEVLCASHQFSAKPGRASRKASDLFNITVPLPV